MSAFLVYICGDHPKLELEKVFKDGENTANEFYDKLGTIFPINFFNSNEDQYVFSARKTYTKSFLYSEYLKVSRNTHNWLNVIFGFFHFQRSI